MFSAGDRLEVEAVEALDRREPRRLDPALDHPALAVDELQLHQAGEEADVVQAFGGALAGQLLVFPQEGRQLERLEVVGEQDLGGLRHAAVPRHQAHVAGRRGPGDGGARQIRVDVEVELGRALLDPAQHQVLDGVEADGAHAQRGLHRGMQVVELEGLQQPQHLHVLPAPRLDHPRLHQPAQGLELGRQVPLGQRRRLVQRADLLLEQRQVVDRIEDHVLAVVAPGMAGDDLAAAADHHLVDVAPDPDVAVAIGDRHRVVVGLVAHQRLRTDPPRGLVAGVERRGRQVVRCP